MAQSFGLQLETGEHRHWWAGTGAVLGPAAHGGLPTKTREVSATSKSHSRKFGEGARPDEWTSDLSQTDMDRCRREVVELGVLEAEAPCMKLGCFPRRWDTSGGTMMSVALVRIRNRSVDRSRCFV